MGIAKRQHKGNRIDDTAEQLLIDQLAEGNPNAFYGLSEYTPRLAAILSKKFGALIPQEDIKDIVSDTLIEAFKKGARYNPQIAGLFTWLNTIAHYQALAFLRTRSFTDETLDEVANQLAGPDLQLQVTYDDEVPSLVMERLLQKLPNRQAQAIRLHYYRRLSMDQIAELMGIGLSTARSTLTRARKHLRRLAEEYDQNCE